ncbi:hypothetical protein KXW23_001294, partial [Aspergillus fumigatus]
MSTERPGIRDTGEKGKKDMTDLSICKYRETSNKIQLHRHHGLITPVVSTTSTTWTEGNPAKSTDIDTLQVHGWSKHFWKVAAAERIGGVGHG